MARRVYDRVLPARRPKRDFRCIDRNVLLLLLDQRIEQKGIFKFHPLSRARLLHHVDLPCGQRVRILQNPADERGFSMIDVADENNLQRGSR